MLLSLGLPATIPATGNVSGTVSTQGFTRGAVGVKSTQAGVLTVQRCLDSAGAFPIGAALTTNLTANTEASVNWTDGAPSNFISVTVTNTSGSVANLTTAAALSP